MIDKYFKAPIFWDYFSATILSGIVTILWIRKIIFIPKEEYLYSVVSDLCTISLTMAGFILTLLTVLISFKSTTKSKKDITENDSLYEIFFSTQLYFQTVKHLKNAIKSLTIIAVTGYVFKLCINSKNYSILFTYNVFGILIIFFTLWRCLVILSRIIKIQQEE